MEQLTTKEKILKNSILLFNQNGMINVRLQHIADQTAISVGNLAYHYHSKGEIIKHIVLQLNTLLEPIIDCRKEFPGLMDFDTQVARYYHILIKYSFFFVDLLELKRSFPRQYIVRKEITNMITSQIHNWLKKNEADGILRKELRPNHYMIIAHTIWMIITFYLARPIDHGSPEDSERVFKEMVWSQIIPHFTEAGRSEFDLLIERLLDSFTPDRAFDYLSE